MLPNRFTSEFLDSLKKINSSIDFKFILEIIEYKKVSLGFGEENCLNYLSLVPQSAYSIYSEIVNLVNSGILIRKWEKEMAYPNVHKKLKRLATLGLIEFEGKYERNVIKYKITSRGLFQLILESQISLESILENNDDIIFRTIVYEFFEIGTIQKFITVPRREALRNYLANCSKAIMRKLESLESAPYIFSAQEIADELEYAIQREIQRFVFLIVIQSKGTALTEDPKEIIYLQNPKIMRSVFGKHYTDIEKDPNFIDLFPKPALMRDRKFLPILAQILKKFDEGSKDYRSSCNSIQSG